MPQLFAVLLLGLVVVTLGRTVLRSIAQWRYNAMRAVREYDMERVALFASESAATASTVPSRTWADLDMDAVFQRIDRTASWPGQHLLFARLRREDHSAESLREFDDAVTRLADDEPLRRRMRGWLRLLDDRRASSLPNLFQGDVPAPPPFARAFPLLTLLGIALLVASAYKPVLLLAVGALAVVNVLIRTALKGRVERVLIALRAFPAMLVVGRELGALGVSQLERLTAPLARDVSRARLRGIGNVSRWLSFQPGGGVDEIAGALYEYVNMVLLLDVTSFAWSIEALRVERDTIRRVYEAIGELDAIQSVATLRAESRVWARPVVLPAQRVLEFAGLTHPLLDEPVPSALELRGASMLLTGSNMSGKSTFIRTIGVNALLARTLNMVLAERWRAPDFAVRTSIGRSDSLLEGVSYYRAEVDGVRSLIGRHEGQHLVLIDELFRGTNSIERIAAAKAVLARLDRGDDMVIVATHDVELLEMLPDYRPYHFREEVRDGCLIFDYVLRAGACSTRNALAILELADYPSDVVEDARRTAEQVAAGSWSRTRDAGPESAAADSGGEKLTPVAAPPGR